MRIKSRVKDLYYTGNNDSDVVFVVVHGGPGAGFSSLRDMEGIEEIENYYQFVYYDQCIVNLTPKKITKSQLVEELSKVIDTVSIKFPHKKIVLFSVSFGCLISLLTFEKTSVAKRLSGIVLCSPFVYKNKEEGANKFNLMVKEFVGDSFFKLSISKFISLKNFDSKPLKLIYKLLGKEGNLPRHIAQVSDWMYEQELSDGLNNVDIPILIIQGENDKFSVENDVEMYVKDKNLDIDYEKIAKSGHDVPKDSPYFFELAVTEFIDGKL